MAKCRWCGWETDAEVIALRTFITEFYTEGLFEGRQSESESLIFCSKAHRQDYFELP